MKIKLMASPWHFLVAWAGRAIAHEDAQPKPFSHRMGAWEAAASFRAREAMERSRGKPAVSRNETAERDQVGFEVLSALPDDSRNKTSRQPE